MRNQQEVCCEGKYCPKRQREGLKDRDDGINHVTLAGRGVEYMIQEIQVQYIPVRGEVSLFFHEDTAGYLKKCWPLVF